MIRHLFLIALFFPFFACAQTWDEDNWKHFSTTRGDLEVPNPGNQQTSSLIIDVDGNGINEFIITERTSAPAVVMYKLNGERWERYVVDDEKLRIEAGAARWDIDKDGDMDMVFGGDSESDQVWWWENPYPDFQRDVPWKRHLVKDGGEGKHHDQIFGDFDGDGRAELVFWNQYASRLFMAEIPGDPRNASSWDYEPIFVYSTDSQMEQRGQEDYPGWKGVNEHEGLAKADIDGDGIVDIVGGGLWFKYLGNGKFLENLIDGSYPFSRSAAGQLIEGGRPEVVLVVGDGAGPLMMYEWVEGTWFAKELVEEVDNGHTLDILDFNGDGFPDIFSAEMRFGEENPDAALRVLLGDGKGNFTDYIIASGFGNHESRMADLDGDGDIDILGKPYSWKAPRLDIWINREK